MKIKDYKCKCGCDDFFFADKGNQKGIYCSYCGKWLKWADKDEHNLRVKQESALDKIRAEIKSNIELKDNFTTVWINGVEYEPKSKRPPSGKCPSDICDKCGNESFRTTNSRNKDGYRMRDKECLICGNKWKTIEYKYRPQGRPKTIEDDEAIDKI